MIMSISSLFSLEKCFYKAQSLQKRGNYKMARILTVWYNLIHSSDIQPDTRVGGGIKFAHNGIGVVINNKAVIGNNCHIFHGVTIGGRGGKGNHGLTVPQIGDNVIIGAHSLILGGIIIGNNAVIGAGSVVLTDVPDNTVFAGNPAKQIR